MSTTEEYRTAKGSNSLGMATWERFHQFIAILYNLLTTYSTIYPIYMARGITPEGEGTAPIA